MAIDTAAKRRSASGVAFLPLGPGVTPDASKGIKWRYDAGWTYSGNVGSAPATGDLPHNLPFFATFGQMKSF